MKLSELNPLYTRWGTQEICVGGNVYISDRALARLKEVGIVPPRRGNYYGTFYVPTELAKEFQFVPGDPHTPNELYI